MAHPAPTEQGPEARYTSERYFALVSEGVLQPDDRVELLEGVIVAMAPQNPRHASATIWGYDALHEVTKGRAVMRTQMPLVLGSYSVPEPDIAVVPGRREDYVDRHPSTALLVVEVADSSLAQDRLTKAAIYAAAGIPEHWLVNLRDDRVEIFRSPDQKGRRYGVTTIARRGERLSIASLPDASVGVDDLLPAR